MHPLVALLALSFVTAGCGQQPANPPAAAPPAATGLVLAKPERIDDCQPCVGNSTGGSYRFRFAMAPDGGGRVVRSIAVIPPGTETPSQTLEVKDMTPVLPSAKIFFGPTDLNLDGNQDLMILTSQGAANSFATYWLFNATARRFEPLGDYPVFALDSTSKRLKTYERGGSGGMEYEAKEYAFVDGKLTVVRVETQEAVKGSSNFRKKVQELQGSKLVTTKQETVKAPK